MNLIGELELDNRETGIHHLNQSEENYIGERWGDSISNSRKFLELVLQEVTAKHHLAERSMPIDPETYDKPGQVRKYLANAGLLSEKEKQAFDDIYSLLSETGAHPYIAAREQARLMRHLALTLSQFVLLRLRGYLNSKQP